MSVLRCGSSGSTSLLQAGHVTGPEGRGSVPMRSTGRDPAGRALLASTLPILACLVLGLLAGGMIVIGVSIVGFWKSLPPAEFQAWFASHSHRLGGVMIPLGVVGIAATVAAWI